MFDVIEENANRATKRKLRSNMSLPTFKDHLLSLKEEDQAGEPQLGDSPMTTPPSDKFISSQKAKMDGLIKQSADAFIQELDGYIGQLKKDIITTNPTMSQRWGSFKNFLGQAWNGMRHPGAAVQQQVPNALGGQQGGKQESIIPVGMYRDFKEVFDVFEHQYLLEAEGAWQGDAGNPIAQQQQQIQADRATAQQAEDNPTQKLDQALTNFRNRLYQVGTKHMKTLLHNVSQQIPKDFEKYADKWQQKKQYQDYQQQQQKQGQQPAPAGDTAQNSHYIPTLESVEKALQELVI